MRGQSGVSEKKKFGEVLTDDLSYRHLVRVCEYREITINPGKSADG